MSSELPRDGDVASFNEAGTGRLPGYMGIEIVSFGEGTVAAKLQVQSHHVAPNGFLHAATVIALADTACGYGCRRALPDGAAGFTTVELKSNFVGTATDGWITCDATLVHGGRTTQVWDAIVRDPSDRPIAHFRCTQLVLQPRG